MNKKRALTSRGWGGKNNGLKAIGVITQGGNGVCLRSPDGLYGLMER